MPTGVRVLIVDDEPQIQRFLKPSLTAGGFEAESAMTGAAAIKAIASSAPDIVILDLGLPDMDGMEVIRQVRAWSEVPIVVLSARDRESEKIAALDLGADDYVNKPFGIGEMMARLRAALRHHDRKVPENAPYEIDGIVIDAMAHSATRNGASLKLTPKEFELLLALVRNAGKVMTHRQLLSAVWGPAHVEDTQYLRVFIGQLRQKVERNPSAPELIQTEPGVGYRFAPSS